MHDVTSFDASVLPPQEVRSILADYLALEETRGFRRLCVPRFGALAVIALVAGALLHGLSLYERWVPSGVFVAPPLLMWIHERRLRSRITARLRAAAGRKS